jgi:hypothetical protein
MIEDFFHFPLVSTTQVVHLAGAANISANFRKKFDTALMVYSVVWVKLIHEKTGSRKSPDTVPLIASYRVGKLYDRQTPNPHTFLLSLSGGRGLASSETY